MTNCITLDQEYISPYDRKKGRKKKYNTLEELAQAKRDTAWKQYYDNYEYRKFHIKLYKERMEENFSFLINQLFFDRSKKNNVPSGEIFNAYQKSILNVFGGFSSCLIPSTNVRVGFVLEKDL